MPTIGNYFGEKSSKLVDPETENVLDLLDADRTWFSLKDVTELTLIHARQMHDMQLEFE